MRREEFAPLLKSYFERYDTYIIAGHMNPDGDCIGAAVACGLILQSMGKTVFTYFDGKLPTYQRVSAWVPVLSTEEADTMTREISYAFVLVDAAEDYRLGEGRFLAERACDFLCVDHHVRTCEHERLTYVEEDRSATCEILYNLFLLAGFELTPQIAEALLMGVAYDTGGFRHVSTKADTLRMAAAMVDLGADIHMILNSMYHSKTTREMKVLGEVYKKAKLYQDGILLAAMSQKDYMRLGVGPNEVSGIINSLSENTDAEVILYLREQPDKVVVSLRSKSFVDVSKIARTFGGGGHIRAAGCSIEGPVLYAQMKLLAAVRDEMKQKAISE